MSAFPMLSLKHSCRRHRNSIEQDIVNKVEDIKNTPVVRTEVKAVEAPSAVAKTTATASFTSSVPGFTPVIKPVINRLHKENVFANVNYLLANKN